MKKVTVGIMDSRLFSVEKSVRWNKVDMKKVTRMCRGRGSFENGSDQNRNGPYVKINLGMVITEFESLTLRT